MASCLHGHRYICSRGCSENIRKSQARSKNGCFRLSISQISQRGEGSLEILDPLYSSHKEGVNQGDRNLSGQLGYLEEESCMKWRDLDLLRWSIREGRLIRRST